MSHRNVPFGRAVRHLDPGPRRPDSGLVMTRPFDPYRALQVIPEAEPEVIQAAFRTLARKHHPDMGGSQEAMAILNEAWALLRDRRRRALYDRERASAEAVRATRPEARAGTRAEASSAAPMASPTASSPPPGSPIWTPPSAAPGSATVLDFGRYEGRTLAELAIADPDYLEWLVRTRIGSRFRHEVDDLLATARVRSVRGGAATATVPPARRSRFRR